MSKPTANTNDGLTKPEKPKTRLQILQEQAKQLRDEMKEEKKRVLHDRYNRKERAHVLCILGAAAVGRGKEHVAEFLGRYSTITPKDREAVEFFVGIKERPVPEEKKKAVKKDTPAAAK